MVVFFVHLKTAFDMVNRKVLEKAMKESGIRKRLVGGVEEMYGEMKSRMRVKKKVGEMFCMARGVRKRCLLSPLLFSVLVANLRRKMKKGGMKIGEERVCKSSNIWSTHCGGMGNRKRTQERKEESGYGNGTRMGNRIKEI